MTYNEENDPPVEARNTGGDSGPARISEVLDPAAYMAELEDFDITEAQKVELLGILWSIMTSFVRLGFDVKICEQIFDAAGILPDAESLRVEFEDAAKTEKHEGGSRPRNGEHDRRN